MQKGIYMNKTNKYAKKTGLLLGSGLLAVLVGCTTYVEAPRSPQVYAPAAPVEVPPTQVYNPPAPAETPVYVPPQPVQITYVIREERDFYQPLSRYGRWVSVGEYGQCWVPSQVNPDWRPYTNGHWESTDAGWYWASDEPWGWATYHYGRWDWNPDFGWIWVPQTQWAPAWVSFHEGGGYVGWAPLHPSQRFARDRFEHMRDKPVAPRSYVFVKERQFLEPVRPTTVIVNNTTIINKTVNITNIKVVNNTVINEGPRTTIIEKASGKKVHAVPARDLRHQQEAAVLAVQPKTLSPASPTIQPPAHLPTPSEDKARLERLANEAKIKAQVEAQKKAKEQEIKLAQFESARLANEAKLKAQFDAQKLAVEQQLKQAETTRLVNEARVKAALEAQKKAKAEEIK
ncbi:MAG: hypothetical protein JWQ71_106, partial [Pedosphaera sp.]|nr:hypothetical protein [Pedosphaera sp.]